MSLLIVVASKQFTDAKQFDDFQRVIGWRVHPAFWMYPEMVGRRKISEHLGYIIHHVNNGMNGTLITDSDFVLNEFRIAVKEGRIDTKEIAMLVADDASGNWEEFEVHFGQDGELDKYPDLLNFYEQQLMKLL